MSHSTKKKTKSDIIVGCILIAILGYGIFCAATNSEAFFSMAKNTFDLTKQEIYLIPCGMLLFVAFWLEMKNLIFKPFMQLQQEREEVSQGNMESSQALEDEADSIEKNVVRTFNESKIELMKTKIQKIDQAKIEANHVIKQAQIEAEKQLKETRAKNILEHEELKKELVGTNEELTNAIVNCFHIGE